MNKSIHSTKRLSMNRYKIWMNGLVSLRKIINYLKWERRQETDLAKSKSYKKISMKSRYSFEERKLYWETNKI